MEKMKYLETHEWVTVDGDIATIGITNIAQEQLSDLVYIDLPDVGMELSVGSAFMNVESVKSSSDIYAPVAGEIIEVNEVLEERPELVNESAESEGWFVKVKMSDSGDLDALLSKEDYEAKQDS